MINHSRTLLINRGRDGSPPDFPGEEFIDPDYIRRKLPPHLLRLHQLLFGQTPDRLFLNYRARQLLLVLHSTELGEFVLRRDPRVTYLPFLSTDLFDAVFDANIRQFAGPDRAFYMTGEYTADEGRGLSQQRYRLDVLADNTLKITRQRPTQQITEITYSLVGGLSLPITLPGSSLSVRFPAPAVGTAWQIDVAGRPASDIGQLLARIETSLGDGGVLQIFPPPYVEPIRTFKRVWEEHNSFLYRISALLLAAIEQINVAPQDL